jgi:hypothetical protein
MVATSQISVWFYLTEALDVMIFYGAMSQGQRFECCLGQALSAYRGGSEGFENGDSAITLHPLSHSGVDKCVLMQLQKIPRIKRMRCVHFLSQQMKTEEKPSPTDSLSTSQMHCSTTTSLLHSVQLACAPA